jgi:iron complex outermembrane recepter protein
MGDLHASTGEGSTRGPHRNLRVAISVVLAAAAQSALAQSAPGALEEIVVTATRREESVIAVPYNISAISGRDISAAGITDLQGLERIIPGLIIPDLGARGNSMNSNIILRGMNTNDTSSSYYLPYAAVPLVSTYVDDIAMYTNLNLTDVARVEVLRGPQGTLYGSGSVAGTLRLIHNRPDPTQFSAEVNAEGSNTSHADSTSSNTFGVVNLPLNVNAALRIFAGYERTAGFIDAPHAAVYTTNGQPVLLNPSDPLTSPVANQGETDIDQASSTYARAALLWNLSDQANLLLAYQHQKDISGGESSDTPGTPFQLQYLVPNENLHRTVDLGSLTLSEDFGFATVTSATSYYVDKSDSKPPRPSI